ncbi:iron-containing redox enzyme family protein [Brevibacterium album]|uniref:iron-containing redox enzyme family protein n=1 Tax=Brevibacterium album TaxID=417948 RepID=UPI0003F53495|nr:iron-containing redox enzyme family protein [Brevibacterium album]
MTLPIARPAAVPPESRGPLSAELIALLSSDGEPAGADAVRTAAHASAAASADVLRDEDLQLSLFLLYQLHYGPEEWVRGDREWHPGLLAARAVLERALEDELRARIAPPAELPGSGAALADLLFSMTADAARPTLATWFSRRADEAQLREFLVHRSLYTLREADPHSWAIPRLRGRAKAALVEIQADEYGGGRPDRVHAEIFARTMRGLGLDSRPEAYLDLVPAGTLLPMNAMSMFGLNRRLRGAIVGHLAAFEMTSSIPNRHYSRAFGRLGWGSDVREYFDEHVEADAVHEQIAARDLAGGLADEEPALVPDIVFGAAACLFVDDLAGAHLLTRWQAGASSLRCPAAVGA